MKVLTQKLVLINILVLISTNGYCQIWTHVERIIGTSSFNMINTTAIDKQGNILLAGSYGGGSIAFDNIQLGSSSDIHGYFAKYDSLGNVLWVKDFATIVPQNEGKFMINRMVLDELGNIYVIGSYSGWPKFSPSIQIHSNVTQDYGRNSFLAKYDKNGNCLWAKSVGSGSIDASDIVLENGTLFLTGSFHGAVRFDDMYYFKAFPTPVGSIVQQDAFLIRYDLNGKALWAKRFGHEGSESGKRLKVNKKGDVYLSGFFDKTFMAEGFTLTSSTGGNNFLLKCNVDGEVQWLKKLGDMTNSDIAVDGLGSVYSIGGYSTAFNISDFEIKPDNGQKIYYAKISSEGTPEWVKTLGGDFFNDIINIESDALGNMYVVGHYYGNILLEGKSLKNNGNYDAFISKIGTEGDLAWTTSASINKHTQFKETQLTLGGNGKVMIAGSRMRDAVIGDVTLPNVFQELYFAQLRDTVWSSSPMYNVNIIEGKVYRDINRNCQQDLNEMGMPNLIIKAEPGSYYGLTDTNGNFRIEVSKGAYVVSQIMPSIKGTSFEQVCPVGGPLGGINVVFDKFGLTKQVSFGNVVQECSQLTVDIAADRRRRCFRSNTTVTYTNDGSADAHNVKIKVLYPKYVVPISSSLPWVARQDSALIFDIGTLKAGERKSFVIADSTICGNEGIRGLSQCVKAIITPKSTCISPNQEWDESSVLLSANFTNQEQTAEFTIINEGAGDMTDSTSYRVFANTSLVKEGKVKLKKGAATTLEIPATLATYRLEADQVPHHPGQSRPAVSLQPSVIPTGVPSMAMPTPIDHFYQDDADAEVDISCLDIIDSYDPNDKQVSPQGITARRYIKENQDLEYLIRFQNTGTDVAYNVIIRDTINEHLDIASLKVGSASHPLTYTVSGKGKPVVTFTFKNINLPDHKTNEPGSHGFVKFTIAQNLDNPKGTKIRNKADIYFDYNSPITTNEVFNIIGDTIIAPPAPVVVYDCGLENPSVAQAGADLSLCEADQTTLNANVPTKGKGRWRIVSGQATIENPDSPTSAVRNIGYGETVLEWGITLCKKISASQIRINRYQIPAAPTVAALPLQCEGATLQPLVATGSNITWYQDAAKKHKLATGNRYTPTVAANATFYATQTLNGCESPVSAAAVTIHLKETTISVHADTLVTPAADSYQWYFNDKPLAGAQNQRLFVRNSGLYRVKTVTNGCEANSINVNHQVNLPEPKLKLYPNPVRGELLLEVASKATGEGRILVRNQLGKLVMELPAMKEYTVLEQKLNTSALASGMYFLEVFIGKEAHSLRFVKQ